MGMGVSENAKSGRLTDGWPRGPLVGASPAFSYLRLCREPRARVSERSNQLPIGAYIYRNLVARD